MNWVVLSSNCNFDYAFLLPTTARAWAKLGYNTIFMLVGSEEEWKKFNPRISSETSTMATQGHKVVYCPKLNNYSVWTTANIIRLYAGCLDLPDSDYVIVGDADLWVLDPSYILKRDSNFDVNLWYANAFNGTGILQFPMCHVGSSVKVWREVMKHGIEPIQTAATQDLDKDIGPGNDKDVFYNEKYYAKKLCVWNGYPKRCQFINRQEVRKQFPTKRLDRSNWKIANPYDYIDAHLPRNITTNWNRISYLLPHILKQEDISIVNAYCDSVFNTIPNVDIILPTYNHAKFIARAVDSVLTQDFKNFRLIIVNDGSTDNTIEVLSKYTDPRILIVNHSVNRKLPAALNTGHASGYAPYCTWVSSDNVCYKRHMAALYETITAGGFDFVQGRWAVNKDGVVSGSNDIRGCKDNWGYGNICASFMYKRSVWETYRYDEAMSHVEDLKFYLQAFLHPFKFGYTEECLVEYYRQPDSMTAHGCKDYEAKMRAIYEQVVRPKQRK